LKDVLLHKKNEEIEHAAMLMEWIRRHSEHSDRMLRRSLFTEAVITGPRARIRRSPSREITCAIRPSS